ncbi:ParB/RepB/Spo0J family partition protein [Polaromonas sp.]|uniref:ParB/RepB/Spo0J family partition protein n=1 Tax=Polaromonas sp. TaxID=1869339 RepID=UPI0013B5EB59|nr:ParB/RepB/Spo0J family partition protein [Polaromonas sp.]NDP63063.1 ParB/RepB/Spo0J family partition protein [Polaromonas sp.]
MHTEPTSASAPEVKTNRDIGKAANKTRPPMTATRNSLPKPAKTAPPKTMCEEPLSVLPTAYQGKLLKLDSAAIQVSRWSNRLPNFVDTSDFKELVDLITKTGGNTVPVLVRMLPDNSYELVYGHRRVMACQHAGLKVNALVAKGLTDEQCIRHMAQENIGRDGLSLLEQGQWYARLRAEQVYKTDGALSHALGVDKGDLSKALSIARLHPVIINAFSSPRDLQYRFANALTRASALKPDQADIQSTEIYLRALAIAALRSSADSKLNGREVYDMLLGAKPVQPAAAHGHVTCPEASACALQEVLKIAPLKAAGDADEHVLEVMLEVTVAACETNSQKQSKEEPQEKLQEEPCVGPSNTELPTFRKQNKEAVSLGAIDEERAECQSVVAQDICMAACQSSSGKTAGVGRSNIWCPIMTDDTNVIGAVTAAENGTALVELSLALSEQQCDLLALAVGKLLSDAQYAGTTPSVSSLNDQEAS